MVAAKAVWKKTLESILVAELVLVPLFVPLTALAEDVDPAYPSDPGGLNEATSASYPSDPGGLDEIYPNDPGGLNEPGGGSSESGSGGYGLGNLGGILSSSGVSCGGGGGSGGILGSIFGGAVGSAGKVFGGLLGGKSSDGSAGGTSGGGSPSDPGGLDEIYPSDPGGLSEPTGTSYPSDPGGLNEAYPSDPGGLNEFGGGGSPSDPGGLQEFGGGNLVGGGGGDFGGIGSAIGAIGGLMGGGGEVPVNDKTVRNETARIRGNTGELVKKECIMDPIAKAISAVLLKSLGTTIISWIQNSNVGFIQNYEQEFRSIEARRNEEFITNFSKVQTTYNANSYVSNFLQQPRPGDNKLLQKFSCPVQELKDGSFSKSFYNGGWEVFAKKLQYSQCSAQGTLLLAMDENTAQVQDALRANLAETQANRGYRGYGVEAQENCQMDDTGQKICTTERETRTPGEAIADLSNRIFGSGIDWTINSDEVNEAITSSILFVIDTLVTSSSGSNGQGVYAPALSSSVASPPGVFSESTVMVQLNTQIARADKGIQILDTRLAENLSAVLTDGGKTISLRKERETLVANLAKTTDEGQIAAINAQIASVDSQLNSALATFSSKKARFLADTSNKESVSRARADILSLKSQLLTTTKIGDVERIAVDVTNLTNALDVFFEIAGVAVVSGTTGTADIKISTIEQIDQTAATGNRASTRTSTFMTEANKLNVGTLTSSIPTLSTKNSELNGLVSKLASIRVSLSAATGKETIRTTSISATNTNIQTTAKIAGTDGIIASAISNFNP